MIRRIERNRPKHRVKQQLKTKCATATERNGSGGGTDSAVNKETDAKV